LPLSDWSLEFGKTYLLANYRIIAPTSKNCSTTSLPSHAGIEHPHLTQIMPSEATLEPLAKRRKLGVHKPFVSPLKRRIDHPARPTSSNGIFKKPAPPASALNKTTNFTSHNPSTPTPSRTRSSLASSSTNPHPAPTPNHTFISPLSTSPSSSTTALHQNLLTLRSQLDTLQQTHRILSQDKATELSSLRDKWRTVTRLAAEELYANVKERVNRMGGVSAWREGEMQRRERVEEWAREDRERAEREEDVISSDDEDSEDDDDDEEEEDNEASSAKRTPAQKARLKAERKANRAASRASRLEARDARREARAIVKAEMADENEEVEAQGRAAATEADLEKGLIGRDDDVCFFFFVPSFSFIFFPFPLLSRVFALALALVLAHGNRGSRICLAPRDFVPDSDSWSFYFSICEP